MDYFQLFLANHEGEVKFYDVERFTLSPAIIPNAWQMHEETLRKSGIPGTEEESAYVNLCQLVPTSR